MNEKKIYTEQEAKEYSERVSNTIYVYEKGDSDSTERQATENEKVVLFNTICGALLTIRRYNFNNTAVQAAKDTAEFTADLMLPYINGYESVYNKIGEFIEMYK